MLSSIVRALSRHQSSHGVLVVYQALYYAEGPLTSKSLALATGFNRATVQKALRVLRSLGLVALRAHRLWLRVPPSGAALARLHRVQLGTLKIRLSAAQVLEEAGEVASLEPLTVEEIDTFLSSGQFQVEQESVTVVDESVTNHSESVTEGEEFWGRVVHFSPSGVAGSVTGPTATTTTTKELSTSTSSSVAVDPIYQQPYSIKTQFEGGVGETLGAGCNITAFRTLGGSELSKNSTAENGARGETSETSSVEQVFGHWVEACGYEGTRLTKSRRQHIEARLREGFTVADFREVIDWVAGNAWFRGENDRGRAYDDFSTFARSESRFQHYLDQARQLNSRNRAQLALMASDRPVFGIIL